MRLTILLREAWAAARAATIPSLLVAFVVAATCFAGVVTVGRQAAIEASIAQTLSGPGARMLTVTDNGGTGVLTPTVIQTLRGIDGVATVIATAMPTDTYNGALGPGAPRVAVVPLAGAMDQAVELVSGRWPGPGEVILGADAQAVLGLAAPVGYLQAVQGQQWSVVGSFRPLPPFEAFTTTALTTPVGGGGGAGAGVGGGAGSAGAGAGGAGTGAYQQVKIVATSASEVKAMQAAALVVIAADPAKVQITSAAAAAGTSQEVAGALAGYGRSLLLLILGVGAAFVAVVVLADVLIHRRDLGRRRTLGITRADLVTLVCLRTTTPAIAGAILGTAAGAVVLIRSGGGVPPDFAGATAVLATLVALLAALPPATYAATRDPVDVMRTP